jgi:hypothetical protein
LASRDAAPRCGLLVIDTRTGQAPHWLRFEHTIEELYDVAALPGVPHELHPVSLDTHLSEERPER